MKSCRFSQKELVDKFPDCKRESAKCVIALTTVAPQDIHLHFSSLLSALVVNMSHQRSKVRQVSLQAAGALAQCGGEGLDRAMKEHLIPIISRASEDRSAAVRKEGVKVVSSWFELLPGIGAYEHALLPPMLSAVADPALDLAKFALAQLEATSEAIEESDTIMDDEGSGGDVEAVILDSLPEPFEVRPGRSVRALVARIMPRMLPTIIEETRSWTLSGRIRASKILRTMLVCAEGAASAHLVDILDALCKMFTDDEAEVRSVALECARVVGACVPPSESLPILFTRAVGEAQGLGSSEHQAGALFVVSSLVSAFGASALVQHAPEVARVLAHPRIRESESDAVRAQAIEVADAMLDAVEKCSEEGVAVCREGIFAAEGSTVARDLLVALLQIQGSATHEDPEGVIPALIAALAGLSTASGSADDMFQALAQDLMTACFGAGSEAVDIRSLNAGCPQLQLFDQVVRTVGSHNLAAAGCLGAAVDVFATTLCSNDDPEVRMAMLALLDTALEDGASSDTFRAALRASIPRLCMDVLRPNLVWRAGRVAATIRKVSMFCLRSLLQRFDDGSTAAGDSFVTEAFLPGFIASIKSCLDDNDADTRRFSCYVLEAAFSRSRNALGRDFVLDIYADLVKRLDDSNDSVRKSACEALLSFVKSGIKPDALMSTALEYTTDALLVHLDDADADVQSKVLAILIEVIKFDPAKVEAKAHAARSTHRSPTLCDEIVARCQAAR